MPLMIGEGLEKARDYPKDSIEDDEKILRSFFEGLHQKSEKALKK